MGMDNNKKYLLIAASFVLIISLVSNMTASAQTPPSKIERDAISDHVEKMTRCEDVTWQEEEAVNGVCIEQRNVRVCDDEANTSCHQEKKDFSVSCVKEIKKIEKTRRDCATAGYKIYDTEIDTSRYGCSTEENNGEITVICDSNFDGNGDGICTSGESCMKFIFDGNSYQKSEKNSKDDFISDDKSFFLEKIKEGTVE